MNDREQWFRIVMGQSEVAELIPSETENGGSKLPTAFGAELVFDLSLESASAERTEQRRDAV